MNTITIAGKTFSPVRNSTVEHDFWLMGAVRKAGLDRVNIQEGEAPEEFAVRLLQDVINSGQIFDLLGGLILPEGMSPADWTPELAKTTGDFLKKITDSADKVKIQSAVVEMLMGFFETGLSSLLISQRSSIQKADQEAGAGSVSAVR